jgi:hypothetical protein
MARPKKTDYKKLSIEEFEQVFNSTVDELKAMLKVRETFNLNLKKAGPVLSELGLISQNQYGSNNTFVNEDPAFSQYVRTPLPNYSELNRVQSQPIQYNPDAIENLDLIVTPLDPSVPSGETFRGNAVAPLADQGIPVLQNPESPKSQLEVIEASINNRLLELESTLENNSSATI